MDALSAVGHADLRLHAAPRRTRSRLARGGESLLWCVVILAAGLAALLVLLIAAHLVGQGLPLLLREGPGSFFGSSGWWPLERQYNVWPMLAASAALTIGALVLALPLGVASALYLEFHAPRWLALAVGRVVEASAAVPTVIHGLWGATVLVPLLGRHAPPGASLLAGVLVLALMVFPTVCLLAQSALQQVPTSLRHAALALGVSEPRTLWHVVLPSARHGLFAAGVLAAARAIGETMVVLMVCGNIVQLPGGWFEPVRALTANIALELPYALGEHRAALFLCGLLVMLLVAVLVGAAEWLRPRQHPAGSAA
jgi:phosphate transport system permease protein